MERRRRRLFTVAISAGAVLVIAAAAASGLFQLVVQAVPGYRGQVEQYVRQVTGRPVRIGALGLTWRYYYPSLELINVALLADDGKTAVLQAERLRLGFNLARLARKDYRPNRLELVGLAVDVRIDRDGAVQVKGIEESEPGVAEPLEALKPLTQFAQLRLSRCRLNLRDERRGSETYSFGIEQAQFDRGLLAHALHAEVALPASIGDTAVFDATFGGELLEPATWTGTGSLQIGGLVAGPWLAPYLERGAGIDLTGAEATVEARFEHGRLAGGEARLRSGPVRGHRARHEARFDALDARARLDVLDDGWRVKLERLAVETPNGRWPSTSGELRATRTPGAPTRYDARAEYLRLGDLAPWLQVLPVPAWLAAFDGAAGEVRNVEFRLQGSGDERAYGYRARFENLALPAADRPAGVSGLRGELAGDESGGRAVLQDSAVTIELPGMLATPAVPLESLEGEVEWRRLDDAWQFGLPQFRWQLWSTRGQGRLALTVPDDRAQSPSIDLAAQFSAEDATRAKPLMPLHWGPGLRAWLDRAIVSGRAPHASLAIKGPLRDFPFVERRTGAWSLDIDADNILLEYQPDWPAVENLAASLHFTGTSLSIQASAGSVAGNPIQSASARFPDFHTGELLIDGAVAGETARFYDFLERSPLRETFKGLLAQTRATGPAGVEIHLDIPVAHAHDTVTGGRVTLDGVELRLSGLGEPIRDIRGAVAFDGAGIRSDRLTGKLYELPLEAQLTPQPGNGTLLSADYDYTVDASGKGASELVPAWVRRHVAGTSHWRATMPIGGKAQTAVTLATDLAGVEVKLPAPLGKPAAQPQPLTLTIGSAPDAPLRITADYQGRLAADLRFVHGRDAMVLDAGTLTLGGGAPVPPQQKGLVLGGELGEVDARAWAEQLQGGGIESQMQAIRGADLHVARAVWKPYALREARWQWTARKDGWALVLSGAGGTGEVRWRTPDRGLLRARLDALALDYLPGAAETPETSVMDPNQMPLLDLDVGRLAVGPTDLGHVVLATERTDIGQKTRTLAAQGGSVTLSASGEWRRRAGQSSASLDADLTTRDIAGLLRAFGYTPNIDAKKAQFKGALAWAPSESGIDWAQARGTVHLDFETGQLRAVEPGAGRVLGLVNFYALPRRLTLNFRDVVSSGLGFDKVEGEFELADGNATTQNLRINGPSLRMDMRGRIGLAARDYDQQVTVYPDVSAGVTLGAVLLGGPVAGVLALIAQEVLNKPLDQVTQLSYRLTGSWDNPQVERVGGPLPAPKRHTRPDGPTSRKP